LTLSFATADFVHVNAKLPCAIDSTDDKPMVLIKDDD